MAEVIRRGAPVVVHNAVAGAAAGPTLDVGNVEVCTVELSGTYTNLEATFQVSIDGGTRFWDVAVTPITGGSSGPKMTTPGLYQSGDGFRTATHLRVPISTPGSPTGSMTVKVVFVAW